MSSWILLWSQVSKIHPWLLIKNLRVNLWHRSTSNWDYYPIIPKTILEKFKIMRNKILCRNGLNPATKMVKLGIRYQYWHAYIGNRYSVYKTCVQDPCSIFASAISSTVHWQKQLAIFLGLIIHQQPAQSTNKVRTAYLDTRDNHLWWLQRV